MTKRRLLATGTAGLALTLLLPTAHAVLGEPLARRPTPRAPRPPRHRAAPLPAGVQMVERASGDGGWIREYVSPQGIVFAVSWNTRFKSRAWTRCSAATRPAMPPRPRERWRGRARGGAASGDAARRRPGRAVQRLLNTFHGRAWAFARSGRLRCGHAAMRRLLSAPRPRAGTRRLRRQLDRDDHHRRRAVGQPNGPVVSLDQPTGPNTTEVVVDTARPRASRSARPTSPRHGHGLRPARPPPA